MGVAAGGLACFGWSAHSQYTASKDVAGVVCSGAKGRSMTMRVQSRMFRNAEAGMRGNDLFLSRTTVSADRKFPNVWSFERVHSQRFTVDG